MITTAIILGLLGVLTVFLSLAGVSNVLPFGIDSTFYMVGQWLIQLQLYLWPLQIVFTIFFKVYLPFLVVLMILRFVLGHRAPGRDVS